MGAHRRMNSKPNVVVGRWLKCGFQLALKMTKTLLRSFHELYELLMHQSKPRKHPWLALLHDM